MCSHRITKAYRLIYCTLYYIVCVCVQLVAVVVAIVLSCLCTKHSWGGLPQVYSHLRRKFEDHDELQQQQRGGRQHRSSEEKDELETIRRAGDGDIAAANQPHEQNQQ